MPQVCILTDSSIQFTSFTFPGHELVSVLPMRIELKQQLYTDGVDLTLQMLPLSAKDGVNPHVLPPSPEELRLSLDTLSKEYDHVLVILLSARLNSSIASAYEVCKDLHSSAGVHIIDSQATSVGLGLIVQAAAEAAWSGVGIAEIKRMLNRLIPRVYTIYCTQSLTYLSHSGQLDQAQALVGEMMGVTAFFLMEHGSLIPVQKARNARNMVDIFEEFIMEFAELHHIAMIQGAPLFSGEIRSLRERIHEMYPDTPYSEHHMGAAVATMLGPRSLGLVTMVKELRTHS
jgi:DegV family protein with EDD domain